MNDGSIERPGAAAPLERLLALMAQLRHPQQGCAWDRAQDFASIAPHTLEEAYEVADAIDRGDFDALRDELGDLLFQVVFHARMAEEAGHFDFAAVACGIADKLVRRHPHLFEAGGAAAERPDWETLKAAERARSGHGGALDGVALALPALSRAQKLQRRAARVGFDWPDAAPVYAKVHEEIAELQAVPAADAAARSEELGDLLFSVVNLARHLGVDAETALRAANAKFERRFGAVEADVAARGARLENSTLEELDACWDRAKANER